MRYMCNGHRQWLIDNPSELTPSWQRATSMGCEAMLGEHWQRAAICFGNAVEVAELELARNPDRAAQQRYLEAAAQMMAAFRRLGDQRSCRFLFSRVLELLEQLSMRDFCEESLGIHIRRQQGCREINVAEVSFNERATCKPPLSDLNGTARRSTVDLRKGFVAACNFLL